MRFLLDQDVYAVTIRFLRDLGHDVVPVAQTGCSQADDSDLLRIAQERGRIFVTRDRVSGGLSSSRIWEQGLFIFACCLQHRMRYIRSLKES